MPKAWSLLTLDSDELQYAGNEGYPDVLTSHYAFDSTVPNHKAVSRGDLAVMRGSRMVLGVGWIESVSVRSGEKIRRRCPRCSKTGFKRRKTVSPEFRCGDCGLAFAKPVDETIDVDFFEAHYRGTFLSMEDEVPVSVLESAYINKATQHAIRELDLPKVRGLLTTILKPGQDFWRVAD